MLSDIEIANKATYKNITELFRDSFTKAYYSIGDDLELYGNHMAKIPLSYMNEENIKKSNLILVTSTSPTKSGIGKTTVSIGLNDALNAIHEKTIAVLREPSLGPCFGMKGGACGGGYSQVIPMDKINLHFTGDFHAITTANNLIASAIDNYFYHNPAEASKVKKITFRRCVDLNDRSLRTIYTKNKFGNLIETEFDITPASEIMAIFCLATDIEDLRKRIDNIIIAECIDGTYLYCSMLNITGSIVALLSDAIKPNLVQSLEHNPVIIHGGPFANIAHGCNSIIATKMGLSLADYVVTEAGFGSDLGAEKFWDIKCRIVDIKPKVVVLVTTIPGLKNQGGYKNDENINLLNIMSLQQGILNLNQHVNNLKSQGHNVIITYNSFESDTLEEEKILFNACTTLGVPCIKNTCFKDGSKGAINLAHAVADIIDDYNHNNNKNNQKYVYELTDTIKQKIEKIVESVYHINKSNISYSKQTVNFISKHDEQFNNYPICIAKTQYSFADNPTIIPIPDVNVTKFHIDEIKVNNGAGFLVVIAGEMMRMPGLPKNPAATHIDYIDNKITGLN